MTITALFSASTEGRPRRSRRTWTLTVCLLAGALSAADDGAPGDEVSPAQPPSAHVVRIDLPITGQADTQIKRALDRLIDRLPQHAAGAARPIIVLEFQGRPGQNGQGSEFERSLSLARYLTGNRLSQVRTVAYLPRSVKGHAVLSVLACDQIVMHADAELGEAGIDEEFIDPAIRNSYRDIAEMRRLIDVNVVQGMLDANLEVFRITTIDDQLRYVMADEFQNLQQQGSIKTSDVVIAAGQLGRISGYDLRHKYKFVSHLASTRSELAKALGIPRGAIQEDPSLDERWNAIQVDLQGPITARGIGWILRSLGDEVRAGEVNLICLRIDSRGGAPAQSVNLANFLSGLDPNQVRTVAYVANEARGDAALVALACDHLLMGPQAMLGGPGDYRMRRGELEALRETLADVAQAKSRDWSLMAAMVDEKLVVHRYTRDGPFEPRFFCQEELQQQEDAQRWRRGDEIDTRAGLTGGRVEQLGVALALAASWEDFKQQYMLEQEPRALEPNWAHTSVQQFADKLASPWLARTLIFVAFIALLSEASAPGLGVPGFVSALCFFLFFWSQFAQGNANILEIGLFLLGLVCLGLEIFVITGFGVFGIGGMLLLVVAIILASQTFVVPKTDAQFDELVYSLSMVLAAGAGVGAGLIVLRRALPNAPILNRLMLKPPQGSQLDEINQREALVDRTHLSGQHGITTTRLSPSGKARFGDETVDVISDGQLITQGSEVRVVDVTGNHVLVRPVEEESVARG